MLLFGARSQKSGHQLIAAFANLNFDSLGGHAITKLPKSQIKGARVLRARFNECSVQIK